MKTNYERPFTTGNLIVSTGGSTSVTVPAGEVWTVIGLMGTMNAVNPTDYMVVSINDTVVVNAIFTFAESVIGGNSYNILTNIVLPAGYAIGISCTATVTDASLIASGIATAIY
jgi:hypothetical protein